MIDIQKVTELKKVKDTLLVKKRKGRVTTALFVDQWYIYYTSRKSFFRYCPCTLLYRYNPHLKRGLKLELNTDLFNSCEPWLVFFWLAIGHGFITVVDDKSYILDYASSYMSDKPFLEYAVQKCKKNRPRVRWSRVRSLSDVRKMLRLPNR